MSTETTVLIFEPTHPDDAADRRSTSVAGTGPDVLHMCQNSVQSPSHWHVNEQAELQQRRTKVSHKWPDDGAQGATNHKVILINQFQLSDRDKDQTHSSTKCCSLTDCRSNCHSCWHKGGTNVSNKCKHMTATHFCSPSPQHVSHLTEKLLTGIYLHRTGGITNKCQDCSKINHLSKQSIGLSWSTLHHPLTLVLCVCVCVYIRQRVWATDTNPTDKRRWRTRVKDPLRADAGGAAVLKTKTY